MSIPWTFCAVVAIAALAFVLGYLKSGRTGLRAAREKLAALQGPLPEVPPMPPSLREVVERYVTLSPSREDPRRSSVLLLSEDVCKVAVNCDGCTPYSAVLLRDGRWSVFGAASYRWEGENDAFSALVALHQAACWLGLAKEDDEEWSKYLGACNRREHARQARRWAGLAE